MNKHVKPIVKQNTYPRNPNTVITTWMSCLKMQSQDHICMFFLKKKAPLLCSGTASHRWSSYRNCWMLEKGRSILVVRWTAMSTINGKQRICWAARKENCRPFNQDWENYNSQEIVIDDMSVYTGSPLSASINQQVYLENLVRFFKEHLQPSAKIH